ncbi:hypothetical protein [Chitinophaga sp. 22620]|uniref:hypothetical protein n=1 Tax=Chitinophaga sp. 22620 TaxID=3453952 RepID=UPI003F8251F9
MKIFITEEYLIGGIQDEFHFRYPHLKLEFFRNPHGIFEGSPRKEKLTRDTPIDDIRDIHSAAWIDIGEFVTAAELEQQFAHLLGLSAQVFRKSGSIWLETTAMDGLTLGDLEAMGRESPVPNEIPENDLNEQL